MNFLKRIFHNNHHKHDDNANNCPSVIKNVRCHLKIAHLHSSLGIYGAERWTLALINHLNSNYFDSVVITLGSKHGADSFFQLLTRKGLAAHHIPMTGRINVQTIVALRNYILRRGIKVLHTHGPKADVIGFFATLGLPTLLVSTIHGWSADEGIRINLYEAISRIFLKKFDRIYPVSPALLNGLIDYSFDRKRLRLVLNAVDLSGLDFKFNERRPDDIFNVLFIGRIIRPKGVFELIKGFSQANLGENARLTILGDGQESNSVAKLCNQLGLSGQVELVGEVPSVVPYLSNGHVLVLPSHSEGIPRVVMEAFATGVAVIGTAIEGIMQLVEHNSTGLLVPVNRPDAIAAALQRIFYMPDNSRKLVIRARKLVVERYSAQRMADNFLEEYYSLLPNS